MSGWLLMGLPGAIFLSGISESWIAIGLIAGAWLNWKIVAGRLRVQTEHHDNALTLPDYFSSRFEDSSKLLRVISAVVILMFFTIYCSSGIVAGARLFESTFGMSYQTALWAGAAATIIYTFVGGFLAISWTDTVQASLMIFALILMPVMVVVSVGGVGDSLSVIQAKSIENLNMLKGLNLVAVLSLLGWAGLGWAGLFWPAAYSGTLYGCRFSSLHSCRPPDWYDLDDPLSGRSSGGGVLWYRLFSEPSGRGLRSVAKCGTHIY